MKRSDELQELLDAMVSQWRQKKEVELLPFFEKLIEAIRDLENNDSSN